MSAVAKGQLRGKAKAGDHIFHKLQVQCRFISDVFAEIGRQVTPEIPSKSLNWMPRNSVINQIYRGNSKKILYMVRVGGLEPPRSYAPTDFKSGVSTIPPHPRAVPSRPQSGSSVKRARSPSQGFRASASRKMGWASALRPIWIRVSALPVSAPKWRGLTFSACSRSSSAAG